MLIIGVDPGSHTGLVGLNAQPEGVGIVSSGTVDGDRAGLWVESLLDTEEEAALAVERFTIAPRTLAYSRTGSTEALYVIGAMRHIAVKEGIPMMLSTPATAKNAVSDGYLRATGLFSAVKGNHARDALRHALLYARHHGIWEGEVA